MTDFAFDQIVAMVNEACDNVNKDSRYTWEPCFGWIRPEKGKFGIMCDTEYGRIYICADSDSIHACGFLFEFSIYWVDGDNNPYNDNGRNIIRETYICADDVEKIMLKAEDINAWKE